MKRRNIIISFLLCACLIVGVGFATLTDELTFTGTANLTANGAETEVDGDVYFDDNVTAHECQAYINAEDNDNIVVSLTDTTSNIYAAGQYATVTATIINEATVPYAITFEVPNEVAEHLTIEVLVDGVDKLAEGVQVPAADGENGILEITLKMTLNHTLADDHDLSLADVTFLGITATATGTAEGANS